MSHVYCSECGFQNPETANYCSRCGALLEKGEAGSETSYGDPLDAAAPRGSFVLRDNDQPVVLISAGVGATPVLAMLHALATAQDHREVWWIHGARNGQEHASELLRLGRPVWQATSGTFGHASFSLNWRHFQVR